MSCCEGVAWQTDMFYQQLLPPDDSHDLTKGVQPYAHRLLQKPLAPPDCLQALGSCGMVLLQQAMQALVCLLLLVTHCTQRARVCCHSSYTCLYLHSVDTARLSAYDAKALIQTRLVTSAVLHASHPSLITDLTFQHGPIGSGHGHPALAAAAVLLRKPHSGCKQLAAFL